MTRLHTFAVFLAGTIVFLIAGFIIWKVESPPYAASNPVTTSTTATTQADTGVRILLPKAGGTWVAGQTYTVSWTGANLPHEPVTIGIPYYSILSGVAPIYPLGQGYLDAGEATATIDRCFPWHYNNLNTLGLYAGDSDTVGAESTATPIAEVMPLYASLPTSTPFITFINTEPFPNSATFEVSGSGFTPSTTAHISGNGIDTTLAQIVPFVGAQATSTSIDFDPGTIPVDGGNYDIYVSNGNSKSNIINTQEDGCG